MKRYPVHINCQNLSETTSLGYFGRVFKVGAQKGDNTLNVSWVPLEDKSPLGTFDQVTSF